MPNQTGIEKLLLSKKKVFTTEDLAVIWQIHERRRLLERIKYYLRVGKLKSIYKGVYSYGNDYSQLEIAQKLVPLSYISLYTSSQIYGLTFQYYSSIFSISLKSKKINIERSEYIYHKVKDSIFYDTIGLEVKRTYTIASVERTVCDLLYVFPGFAFDNLEMVDIEKLRETSKIYINKRLEKEVEYIIKSKKNA